MEQPGPRGNDKTHPIRSQVDDQIRHRVTAMRSALVAGAALVSLVWGVAGIRAAATQGRSAPNKTELAASEPTPEIQASSTIDAADQAATVEALRQAVATFRASLSEPQRMASAFALDDPERQAWSNLPTTMFKRLGVRFGELSVDQRLLAHRLLQQPLSSQGYLKVAGIMRIDEILKAGAAPRGQSMFGQELFYLGFFGNPESGPWGLQLDGHHLALNLTVVGNQITATPMFLGSDPAEVRTGLDAGWYPLAAEDRRGRALWNSFDGAQKRAATLAGQTPTDVVAGPTRRDPISAIEVEGLAYSQMSSGQKVLLMRLLNEYLHDLEYEVAQAYLDRAIAAGLDKIHFAWSGIEADKPYYFRLQGPTLLIEFDNNYPPGRQAGPVNHIHSVWRDPTFDYGEDLLKKHYQTSPHHQGHR